MSEEGKRRGSGGGEVRKKRERRGKGRGGTEEGKRWSWSSDSRVGRGARRTFLGELALSGRGIALFHLLLSVVGLPEGVLGFAAGVTGANSGF